MPGNAEHLQQDGTWKLDGADINLDKVLTNRGFSEKEEWVAESASWYFVESGGNQPLVIFGGTRRDPDSWAEFKKVR